MTIQVVLAVDAPIVRAGFARLLQVDGCQVVAEVGVRRAHAPGLTLLVIDGMPRA